MTALDVSLEEVARRLGEDGFVVLDVRTLREHTGEAVAPCDPRPGRIPGSRHLELGELMTLTEEEIRARLGPPEGQELVAYCHSGSRSQLAGEILRAAGYEARNYRGSWHEWSRDQSRPAETGAPFGA